MVSYLDSHRRDLGVADFQSRSEHTSQVREVFNSVDLALRVWHGIEQRASISAALRYRRSVVDLVALHVIGESALFNTTRIS